MALFNLSELNRSSVGHMIIVFVASSGITKNLLS